MWAERYDQDLQDIFAVQDEVTQKIVDALSVKFTTEERIRLGHATTSNLEAYDDSLRADTAYQSITQEPPIIQARDPGLIWRMSGEYFRRRGTTLFSSVTCGSSSAGGKVLHTSDQYLCSQGRRPALDNRKEPQ